MINKVILMGRLTRDPELRHTGSGTPVASFTVAVDDGYGDNKTTSFINCVAWSKQAEFVSNYFTKGRMIIVIGRIQTRTWEGQDGKKNYVTEVVASEVSFGETKKSFESGGGYVQQSAPQNSQYGGSYQQSQPVQNNNSYSMPPMPSAAEDSFAIVDDTDDDLPF